MMYPMNQISDRQYDKHTYRLDRQSASTLALSLEKDLPTGAIRGGLVVPGTSNATVL